MIEKINKVYAVMAFVVLIALNFNIFAADKLCPSLIVSYNTQEVEDGESIIYTVTAADNERVASFVLSSGNIKLNGFTANIKVVEVSDNKKEIHLSNVQGTNGAKSITLATGVAVDASGNKSEAVTSGSFTLTNADRLNPSVVVSYNTTKVTDGGSIIYTVTAADNERVASFVLSSGNIKLNGFTANIKVVKINDNKQEIHLTNIQGTNGAKSITLATGVAVDASGNKSEAVTSGNFTLTNLDRVAPQISITSNTTKITDGGNVIYIIEAIDNVRVSNFDLTEEDITLNGFAAKIVIEKIGTNKYQVELINIQGTNGDKNIIISAGVAIDASGNKSAEKKSGSFNLLNQDRRAPSIKIDGPDVQTIVSGGRVTYIVTVADDAGIKNFNIEQNDIKLNGFKATVVISKLDNTTIQIILLNVTGEVGSKNITIASGVATDLSGNKTAIKTSNSFNIIVKEVTPGEDKEDNTNNNPGNAGNVGGDVIEDVEQPSSTYVPEIEGVLNTELNGFTAWLRSRKDNEININKYNFVSNESVVTYVIEFYNASSKAEKDMIYTLTIPYGVEVISTVGEGRIIVKNQNATIIQWCFNSIPSGAYGKVEVTLKYTENAELEASKDLSEIFYVKLNVLNANYNFNSFLTQLYVDVDSSKSSQYFGYINGFDGKDNLYVEDEITRLELARLIIDSGLVTIDKDTDAYKNIKDYKLLSEEDRLIIGTLMDLGIMEAYEDKTFKANNPILMDELIKIFAKLTEYTSDSKLITKVSPYIYKEELKNSYGQIVENKYYIMELIRQNVVSLEEINVDKYATRLDAINILNTLTFREDASEDIQETELKYQDVLPEVTYFWNIVSALENYTYTYNNKFEQVVLNYEN